MRTQDGVRRRRWGMWAVVAAGACSASHAAEGLRGPDVDQVWPQWQARLTVNSGSALPWAAAGRGFSAAGAPSSRAFAAAPGSPAPWSGSLLGDYYFATPGLRLPVSLGGLRASSGVWFGPRGGSPAGWAEPPTAPDALPYLGIGYTGLSAKGGFSITADFGLVAERPSQAAGLGRALLGTQGLDRALRELRLSPVLQLGVSYAF